LIISDVIGDPLDVIASGPTVADRSTPADALAVLSRYFRKDEVPGSVWERLSAAAPNVEVPSTLRNVIIGSNRVAVGEALAEARRRGYDVKDIGSDRAGEAAEWGRTLAEAALDARRRTNRPFCMIGGGETTVTVNSALPGKGGRNQEVALAAVERLWDEPAAGIAILSGGTDGEDGPTDAAGAVADVGVIAEARRRRLSPREFLAGHDSYWFFDATGGLIKTGPTHTNVMDLQVVLVEPRRKREWIPARELAAARQAEELRAGGRGGRAESAKRRRRG
jgi:glycerate 2-kinase